jgi:AcrR family transcriptional regulator
LKREEKKQSIREKIVGAIIGCLDENGLDALTTKEIACKSGVSTRTLYKYFGNKKEMYLGIVAFCFRELAGSIAEKCAFADSGDPFSVIECIGRSYLEYCLKEPKKSKILVSYNEEDFIADYPEQVQEIQKYSNTFELTQFIERFFACHQIEPSVSAAGIALYLWSEVQGLATLMLSKESWIKSYYGMDIEKLIDEHMRLGKILLQGAGHEKEI